MPGTLERVRWHYEDQLGSSETELGHMLYGLVLMLKPDLVVETGTFRGEATHFLGLAAKIHSGKVVSCDPAPQIADERALFWRDYHLPITIFRGSSLDCPELKAADFAFLDSDYAFREKEWALLKPGCVTVIHDTCESFNSDFPSDYLGKFVEANGGLNFHAGKGFGIAIKQ